MKTERELIAYQAILEEAAFEYENAIGDFEKSEFFYGMVAAIDYVLDTMSEEELKDITQLIQDAKQEDSWAK